MPTVRPRYTITDTGAVQILLDDAQRQWPDLTDRKELLLRLAQAGHESLRLSRLQAEATQRRERQQVALSRLAEFVDADLLLSDSAWS